MSFAWTLVLFSSVLDLLLVAERLGQRRERHVVKWRVLEAACLSLVVGPSYFGMLVAWLLLVRPMLGGFSPNVFIQTGLQNGTGRYLFPILLKVGRLSIVASVVQVLWPEFFRDLLLDCRASWFSKCLRLEGRCEVFRPMPVQVP